MNKGGSKHRQENGRDSTKHKSPTWPLQIGDSIIYTNEGHNEMVGLVDGNKNNPDSIKYINKLLRWNTMVVTKKVLKSRNIPDIGSITIYSEDYITESNNITQ